MKDESYPHWLATNTYTARGIPKRTLCAASQYYDTFEELLIRDANQGGYAESLVAQADFGYRFTPKGKT